MRFLLLIFSICCFLAGCERNTDPETLFQQGEYETAFELWKPRAQNGDLDAMNYLGIHYYLGLGVRRDPGSARNWFEKAARLGQVNAQYNLGMMYENGESVPQDFIQSYMWYFAAHMQGNKNAEKRMIDLLEMSKIFPNQQKHAQELARPYILKPK